MLTQDSHVIRLTLLGQTILSVGLAALLAIFQGRVAAQSALLGGMIAVLPNAFLAARLLTADAARSARALLGAAWSGEIGKLVLTALLFAAVFAWVRPLSGLALFGGYIAAQGVVFGALLLGGGELDENVKAKN